MVVENGECSVSKGIVGMRKADIDAEERLDEEVY